MRRLTRQRRVIYPRIRNYKITEQQMRDVMRSLEFVEIASQGLKSSTSKSLWWHPYRKKYLIKSGGDILKITDTLQKAVELYNKSL